MNSGSSLELSHESLAFLVMFQLAESDCMGIAAEPDKVTYLSNLLFHSSIEVRLNSAALIENILVGMRSQELRSQISNVDEIFEGVIEILKNLHSYPRGLKVGVKTLFALCLIKQNRQKAVEAGAAETLVDRLVDFDKCDAERALATVELLCRIPTGYAFAEHALMVPLLVQMILKISDRATEYSAGALLSLCSSSEKCQHDAVTAGVLTHLLLLMQSGCTDRAKRKAQFMLKLLKESLARRFY